MADIKDFPDVPGYISIKQAAQLLGITDKRVYRYIDIGRLPAYKSGGVFFLLEEDVKNFKLNPPIREKRLGPTHPETENTRKNYTTCLSMLEGSVEATAIETDHKPPAE
jgi:excisionase family DNA binding protein